MQRALRPQSFIKLSQTHSRALRLPRSRVSLVTRSQQGGSKMPKAEWNGAVLAETDSYETVEGNVYFPPESLKKEYFKDSSTTSVCGWKGTAKYYTVEVDGQTNKDAAWYYPEPKAAANNIKDYVAFWKGVKVTK